MIKGIILMIMFSIAFVVELIIGNIMSKNSGIILLIVIILAIAYEIYDRKKNSKNGGSKFNEKILVMKNSDYYFTIGIILPIMILLQILNIYEKKITTIILIIMVILFVFYGYFYMVSNQIVYVDGVKLMDNKFVGKDDIKEVVYRRSLILNKRIIEINTKKAIGVFRKKVEIKFETDSEFIKVMGILEKITGVKAKNLEC